MWPLMFLLVGFSLVITLYFGGLRVIDGRLTIGTLTAFFGYLVMLIWPMIAFGWVINILQQGAASMGRLVKILDTVPEIADGPETDTHDRRRSGATSNSATCRSRTRAPNRPTLSGINLTHPGRDDALRSSGTPGPARARW